MILVRLAQPSFAETWNDRLNRNRPNLGQLVISNARS